MLKEASAVKDSVLNILPVSIRAAARMAEEPWKNTRYCFNFRNYLMSGLVRYFKIRHKKNKTRASLLYVVYMSKVDLQNRVVLCIQHEIQLE